MKLSIVVIGRNEAANLERALHSAAVAIGRLGAEYADSELLYVDAGSTDASAEIARRNPSVRLLELDAATAAQARNAGIRETSGELVQLLDGDMELDAAWLAAGLARLTATGAAACAGSLVERGAGREFWNTTFGNDWARREGPVDVLGGAALWRRSALEWLGGFDERLPVGEDPDLALRARNAGFELQQLEQVMATHDLGLDGPVAWWRRGLSVGRSRVIVTLLHGDRPEVRRALFAPITALFALVVLLVGGLAFHALLLVIAACAALGLLARHVLRSVRSGLDLGSALVHGVHVYAVKLPIALGAIGALSTSDGGIQR